MMKRIFLSVAITFLFYTFSIAQSGTITGVVKDSLTGVFLESATVSIFGKDSSLINYQLTDSYGSFQLSKVPLKKTSY
ncbi:carboxypeptidase-like regulatory domain-containing protein [Niabella ginsengisoli]|uniref:Carboxypeptidase-like regulatory domain-containing protein n=1 Tax=Niabella ginsengisoli TaxID=522298 RepID=A0ABS9SPB0_9BACT|nr:carboxypeptidase-like regulatory domain-containing protein [Niabella ginsengisoli]MCH5600192.1 carboxypeptidase-like regulatory domain-containing protein [Niabella ginsengisoli]